MLKNAVFDLSRVQLWSLLLRDGSVSLLGCAADQTLLIPSVHLDFLVESGRVY